MADYKIQIGTELDTKGIDAGIKKYQGKPIEIKSKLDTSGIDTAISAYKTKAVNVNTKLNTKGITEAIRHYQSPKKIRLESELSTVGIDNKLNTYNPKALKVDVELTKSSINQQIRDANPSEHIKIKAKLDDNAIGDAINNYKASKPVKIDVIPNFDGIDKKIKSYKITTPITLKAKLNKGDINEAISSFTPRSTIKLKAALQKGVIAEEIRNFKPSTPIRVALELDPTDIDNKISAYKSKPPVEIPAKLKLNVNDINSQLQKYKLTVPIKLNVKQLDTKGLEEKIKNYNAKSTIKVGVQLDSKSINEQIAKLPKLNTPINVGVKLDESAINADIALFKPTATLGIQPDLILENVDDQIRAYVPKSKIKVDVQVNDGDINEKTGKKNVAKNKVSVGIKLDTKGIAEQIRKIEPKTKIKVGIKLDKDSVSQQIQTFRTDTPIKLGVELNEDNVWTQIDGIKKKLQELGNIRIDIGDSVGVGNGGGSNVGIGDSTKFDNSLNSLHANVAKTSGVIESLKTTLQTMKLDTSSIDAVAKDVQELGFEVTNASVKMKNGNFNITVKGIDSIGRAVTEIRQLDSATGKISGLCRTISQSFSTSDDVVRELNKEMASFVKLQSQIANMRTKIGGLEIAGGKSNQVAELKRQLEELENTYDSLMHTFMQKPEVNADIVPMEDIAKFDDEIAAAVEKAENKLRELDAKYADTRAKLASEIKLSFDNGDFNVLSKINLEVQRLKGEYPELTDEIEKAKVAIGDMEAAIGTGDEVAEVEKLISAYNEFQNALQKIKNQLDLTKAAEKDAADVQKLNDDIILFQNKIDAYLTKNSAAANEFGSKLLDLRAKAQGCDRVTLNHLEAEFKQVDKAVEAAGKKTQTFGDSLRAQIKRYSSYLSVASVIMYASQAMRSMFEQVKLIDSAMTELKKVTNESDASYNKFLSNAASRAKELGTTIDGLVASTADFARLGYGFKESQQLAEVANIYAVVGDEIEGVEDATQSLVSTMAAFKGEMNGMSDGDFAMSIVDKMNEVSNNFAISSGGIGQALQRSASSMAAANNTLDETISLITAAM